MSWKTVPIRALYRRKELRNRPDLPLLSVYRDLGVVPREGRDDNFNRPGEDLAAYKVVKPGDLVLNKMKTWQGSIGVSEHVGIVSPAYFVGVPISDVDQRFAHHLFRSAPLIALYAARSKGIRPSQWDLPWEEFASIPVSVPDSNTQAAIADFLDAETARIDGLLDRKRRLVGLAQERIDAEVMEFVAQSDLARVVNGTRSLPLRRLLIRLDREAGPESQMITAFRDGQVTARSLRRQDGFTESWTEVARVQGVQTGDVVVHGLDGFAGAIGTSEAPGCCSPAYHVCSPSDGGDAHFYGRFLRVLATEQYLSLFAVSTRERAVDFRNWDLFGRIPIPVVNPIDQRRIGDRIRALSPLRAAVERSAALVAERKQALITAAVTGQLDLAREIAEEAS